MIKNQILKISIFGIIALSTFNAYAEKIDAVIEVKATVISSCSISATNIDFGNYDPIIGDLKVANGSINLKCVKGSTPEISIDLGKNHDGTSRRAAYKKDLNDPTKDQHLNYDIYQPIDNKESAECPASIASAKKWSTSTSNESGVFKPEAATSNGNRAYKICGFMSANQDVGPGTYTDTVTISANF